MVGGRHGRHPNLRWLWRSRDARYASCLTVHFLSRFFGLQLRARCLASPLLVSPSEQIALTRPKILSVTAPPEAGARRARRQRAHPGADGGALETASRSARHL